ncbi:MAG: phytoene/squalene synthase family protein [Thermogutta sp.]|nr:phytoene/squalene synthase family protein [Thermogutta sp.]HOP78475.1 phytoene/squalene synthase family protein [Thermogutta sp.]HPU07641.1 phytoene/squalene synthase family protein [Thermogutta sp.]HQF12700.1 phytoene/squalene synthase family protein [Thermogutta sp.]
MPRIDPPDSQLAVSYAFCRAICRAAGSSFYPAFSMLSQEKAQAMETIYAFCRFTDDLVDDKLSVDPAQDLETWYQWVHGALVRGDRSWGELHSDLGTSASPVSRGRALLPALVDTVEQFRIPPESLLRVIDGVRSDLTPRHVATFAELEDYCSKVASAVGVACLCVWGMETQSIPPEAHDCGVAFQLTNILRDLAEDVKLGRIYLPQEDFVRFRCSLEDFAARRVTPQWLALLDFEIERARNYYRRAAHIHGLLAPDGRRIFGLMWDVYWQLLKEIARRKEQLLERRVRLSRLRKSLLWLRWMVFPPKKLIEPTSPQESGSVKG